MEKCVHCKIKTIFKKYLAKMKNVDKHFFKKI